MLTFNAATNKNMAVSIPILTKIKNKKLFLSYYHIGPGICDSLKEAFGINLSLITHLNLDNNGLNDENLSLIIEGLNRQSNVKSLIIK
jgi:hypothetical protein